MSYYQDQPDIYECSNNHSGVFSIADGFETCSLCNSMICAHCRSKSHVCESCEIKKVTPRIKRDTYYKGFYDPVTSNQDKIVYEDIYDFDSLF